MMIRIVKASKADDNECPCGNTVSSSGFDTCSSIGLRQEPLIGSTWAGHYVCNDCGRISLMIDDTQERN